MTSIKYQVIALGGSEDGRSAMFFDTLRARIADLGLSPTGDLDLSEDPDVAFIDTSRSPTAAVFFGGPARSTAADRTATILRDRGVFVLPVVPDLDKYSTYVPKSLWEINGTALRSADFQMASITQLVLEELRLVRWRRLVFVSYRRAESSTVAEQLYSAFDQRSFDVFLDTHSVRGGEEFQSVLWDRMADADLLVLIDTPGALSSRWVREELVRAQALGLGTLQLVWPGMSRTPGTEFCEPIYLNSMDFEDPRALTLPSVSVKTAVLDQIVSIAEGLRARSLAARRSRIVGEIWRRANDAGLKVVIQPARFIDLWSSRGVGFRLFPIAGHPDSVEIHCCDGERAAEALEGVVIYDSLGMPTKTHQHLGWLNGFLPLKSVCVTELDEWFRRL